jgi:predicted nucleic acid-binding Zn finger protein
MSNTSVVKVKSFTGDRWYEVDREKRTCTCPRFVEVLVHKGGACKHMQMLGVNPSNERGFAPKSYPNFSQALSALVKTIRLRRTRRQFTGSVISIVFAMPSTDRGSGLPAGF